MAITTIFDPITVDPVTGVLSIFGDNNDDAIITSRDAAGNILVNGGTVPISGGTATVANTGSISISGQGGNDLITLDESNGALPPLIMAGDDGNDTIIGGSGADHIFGGNDNDTVYGQDGVDALLQRLEREREHRDFLRRGRARDLLPRRRQRHDGPQRGRGNHLQRAWGCRQHHDRRRQCSAE